MPRADTSVPIKGEKGVHAARGGNPTSEQLRAAVSVPGRASLRFSNAHMTLVDNARYEPEQVMLLISSSPVTERALAPKVAAYLLPPTNPKQGKEDHNPYQWTEAGEIGRDI